jgi:hypothetical protein
MGAQGQQTAKWLQIDFMKRRKQWPRDVRRDHHRRPVSLGVRGLNPASTSGRRADQLPAHKAYTTRSATSRRKWGRTTRSSGQASTNGGYELAGSTRSLSGGAEQFGQDLSVRWARTSSVRRTCRRALDIR